MTYGGSCLSSKLQYQFKGSFFGPLFQKSKNAIGVRALRLILITFDQVTVVGNVEAINWPWPKQFPLKLYCNFELRHELHWHEMPNQIQHSIQKYIEETEFGYNYFVHCIPLFGRVKPIISKNTHYTMHILISY